MTFTKSVLCVWARKVVRGLNVALNHVHGVTEAQALALTTLVWGAF